MNVSAHKDFCQGGEWIADLSYQLGLMSHISIIVAFIVRFRHCDSITLLEKFLYLPQMQLSWAQLVNKINTRPVDMIPIFMATTCIQIISPCKFAVIFGRFTWISLHLDGPRRFWSCCIRLVLRWTCSRQRIGFNTHCHRILLILPIPHSRSLSSLGQLYPFGGAHCLGAPDLLE